MAEDSVAPILEVYGSCYRPRNRRLRLTSATRAGNPGCRPMIASYCSIGFSRSGLVLTGSAAWGLWLLSSQPGGGGGDEFLRFAVWFLGPWLLRERPGRGYELLRSAARVRGLGFRAAPVTARWVYEFSRGPGARRSRSSLGVRTNSCARRSSFSVPGCSYGSREVYELPRSAARVRGCAVLWFPATLAAAGGRQVPRSQQPGEDYRLPRWAAPLRGLRSWLFP